ncbi:hypothetical protein V2J09_023115 [Rumex salicifolius]
MKIITWNVQGAGSREFIITLKDIIRVHNPVVLVLVKTRLSGRQADKVCSTIGYDGMVRAEAVGFRGGVWVLWRKVAVNFKQVAIHQQSKWGGQLVVLSAIYACLSPQNREELWNHLLGLKGENLKSGLLMGDFNETASMEERIGDSDNLKRSCEKFQTWIDEMELIDLVYSRSKFTWARRRDPNTRTAARLAKGLSNFDWRHSFAEASVKHLAMN